MRDAALVPWQAPPLPPPDVAAADSADELRRQAEKARIRERILREEAEHVGLELEVRRETLLKDDCLAIRCDVAVVEVEALSLGRKFRQRAPKLNLNYSDDDEDSGDDQAASRRSRSRRQPDDREYIRQCLAEQRHRA